MNSRIQKWKAALLSGEFKQAKQQLRTTDDGYCCLGVACEIYRRETGKGVWELQRARTHGDDEELHFSIAGESNPDAMPTEVFKWFGLEDRNPTVLLNSSLADVNDHGGSFLEIAGLLPDGKPDEELETK